MAEDDPAQCRFCLEEAPAETLLTPCNCTGTGRFVHLECLRHWQREVAGDINSERASICQTCRAPFSVQPIRRSHCQRGCGIGITLRQTAPTGPIFRNITTNPNFDRNAGMRLGNSLRTHLLDLMRPGNLIVRERRAPQPIMRREHWNGGAYMIGGEWPTPLIMNSRGSYGNSALLGVNLCGQRIPDADDFEGPGLTELQRLLDGVPISKIIGGPVQRHRCLVLLSFDGQLTNVVLPSALVRVLFTSDGPMEAGGVFFGEPVNVLQLLQSERALRPRVALFFQGHAVWSSHQLLSEVAAGNWGLASGTKEDLALISEMPESTESFWKHVWDTRDPLSVTIPPFISRPSRDRSKKCVIS